MPDAFADRPQEESLLYTLDVVGGEYGASEPEIWISAEVVEVETARDIQPLP
jgi:hypothetical protein